MASRESCTVAIDCVLDCEERKASEYESSDALVHRKLVVTLFLSQWAKKRNNQV